MYLDRKENRCRRLRVWLYNFLARRFTLDWRWIQNHIADCPRCRRRIADLGRVDLAFSLLKSEPHSIDLLRRANAQAIGVLKRTLRSTAKAQQLRTIRPEPTFVEKCGRYKHALINAAACIVIALLMKSGTFFSADRLQRESRKAVEHYYAKQVGSDLASEVFRPPV